LISLFNILSAVESNKTGSQKPNVVKLKTIRNNKENMIFIIETRASYFFVRSPVCLMLFFDTKNMIKKDFVGFTDHKIFNGFLLLH
jgi:hypothetical protein